MRRSSRALALVAVGAALAPALALAGAFPAGAAEVVDYRQYQQTLPASVIAGMGYTPDEDIKVTNNTRTGVVGPKTVIPLKSTVGPAGGLLGMVPGVVGGVMWLDGQLHANIEFDRDTMEAPSWIDADEWNACAPSGGDDWMGNFFDGARDWVASFEGVDCNEVREGWEVEKDPAYEPIGSTTSGYSTFPQTGFSLDPYTTPKLVNFAFDVKWSSTVRTLLGVTRQEGWVLTATRNVTTADANFGIRLQAQNAAGLVGAPRAELFMGFASNASYRSTNTAICAVVEQCIVLSYITTSDWVNGYLASPVQIKPGQTGFAGYDSSVTTPAVLPWVDPFTGSPPALGLERQVLLTTITGASGALYQCRTVSFVETAPTIPRPCEPEVPDWDEIVKRIVEVVPETDPGYVPGSNPSRGVISTEVPEVVRDWQAERDPDDDGRLDLRKIGLGSCFDFPEACLEWFEQEDKEGKYECYDGSRAVSLSECLKYARLFKPGAIAGGTPYPGAGPSPGGAPGTQTGPGVGTGPGSQPANPEGTRNCWAGMISMNPWDWVFTPVKCALEWAFVPRQSYVSAQMRLMQAKWTGSSLISLVGVLEQGTHLALSGNGCSGPAVNLNIMGGIYNGHPLSACASPMSEVATASRVLTMIGAWVMAIASIARSVGGVVGFTKLGGD